ncbi:hypothetical protein Agub_g273 [Astrephomene gubernaculifera]|uniref:Sphingomyelin synthase-like domain-containing protein n=1 Tax=Astrephomene gubernaculifera TaxID=47775 RepID=A0AAD3DFM8_9CHLO|nr:hypothetical protein Agub_g273 [Astrephomene gubernaculifera]
MAAIDIRGVRRRLGNVTGGLSSNDPPPNGTLELDASDRQKTRDHRAAACARCGSGLDVATFAIFLAQPLLRALLGPLGVGTGLADTVLKAVAVLVALAQGWRVLTFRRWRDEHAHVGRFLACFCAMLAELAVENCVVWLVSAWDDRKYDMVPGLQDNVARVVRLAARHNSWVHAVASARWADIKHFLLALLALAFSGTWDQVPYSGFGLMSRVVLTHCVSRLLRMACFLSTVLPNPRPGCYRRRFPPPPDGLWETIKAGYTTIRGFGGCNDLIFSGHCVFWCLVPLAFRTYHPGGWRPGTWLLWAALLHTCVRDVLDEQHYSVDMLLAVVVTWAVWDWVEWVYPPDRQLLPRRPAGTPADRLNPGVVGLILAALALAGVIVIGGKA